MKDFEMVFPNFHVEFPRVFNRVGFVGCCDGYLEVGFGAYAVVLGRWVIAFSG